MRRTVIAFYIAGTVTHEKVHDRSIQHCSCIMGNGSVMKYSSFSNALFVFSIHLAIHSCFSSDRFWGDAGRILSFEGLRKPLFMKESPLMMDNLGGETFVCRKAAILGKFILLASGGSTCLEEHLALSFFINEVATLITSLLVPWLCGRSSSKDASRGSPPSVWERSSR